MTEWYVSSSIFDPDMTEYLEYFPAILYWIAGNSSETALGTIFVDYTIELLNP